MTRLNTTILIFLMGLFASVGSAQSADAVEELKACASMSDPDARIACYDSLSERILQVESTGEKPVQDEIAQPEASGATAERSTQEKVARSEAVAATATELQRESAATTATEPQPLPDDFGKSSIRGDEASRTIEYSGVITSCQQGHYGDWYFIFDNGQIWKETNNRKLRFKDCNFNATISKDGFGYKLKIEGYDKTIRVRRNR